MISENLYLLINLNKAIKDIKSCVYFQLHGTKNKHQADVIKHFKTFQSINHSLSLKKSLSRPNDSKVTEYNRIESLKSTIKEKEFELIDDEVLEPVYYYQKVNYYFRNTITKVYFYILFSLQLFLGILI